MAEPGKKAIFLDRDGTINFDPGYISQPELVKLLPGAAAAIRRAHDSGFLIVVVSNQSGVGRGLIDPEMLPVINERINELLQAEAGAQVDMFVCCTHHPSDACKCRKPLPRLVYEAQTHLGIDLRRSVFIGDRMTDIRTGQSAPVRYTILVRTGDGAKEEQLVKGGSGGEGPDLIADDLASAVDWVLSRV